MKKAYISVCIITYNRKHEVVKSIKQIKKSIYKHYEIFVIDNSSTDGTDTLIPKEFPDVTFVRNKNEGISGKNRAFEKAKGDIILFLDDDSHPTPDALKKIVSQFQKNKKLLVMACNVFTDKDTPYFSYVNKEDTNPQKVYSFNGCGVVMRKTVFKKIGGYSPWVFMYTEETEFALRMLRVNISIWYYPTIFIYHRHSSIGRTEGRMLYYCTRNFLIIAWIYFPFFFALAFTPAFLAESLVSGVRRHAIGAFIKGSLAPLKSIPLIMRERNPLSYHKLYPFAKLFLGRIPQRLMFKFT